MKPIPPFSGTRDKAMDPAGIRLGVTLTAVSDLFYLERDQQANNRTESAAGGVPPRAGNRRNWRRAG